MGSLVRMLVPIGYLLLLSFNLSHSLELPEESVRDKKILSLFSVVFFPNNECTASSSSTSEQVLGICFSSTECTGKGGKADGNCAAGFGVCCTFELSACSSTVSNNLTYIQNPSYPTAYTTTTECKYTIKPLSSDICQIRLDFDFFDLAETATTGACVDTFSVTSTSSRVYYKLCGTLTGQHMYVETARSTSNTEIAVTPGASPNGIVKMRVKVTQIECYSTTKAPADCLQYYTALSDTVTSFNYPTVIISEMMYTACVRQIEGFCGIVWAPTASSAAAPTSFVVDDTINGAAIAGAAAGDNFVIIPGSTNVVYGGGRLSDSAADTTHAVVYSSGVPFRLTVNSNAAGAANGFSLVY